VISPTKNQERSLTEASFAKQLLEGVGDTFRFELKREMPNLMKVMSQIENQEPFAHQSQLR
jgi:hypothetical protein